MNFPLVRLQTAHTSDLQTTLLILNFLL